MGLVIFLCIMSIITGLLSYACSNANSDKKIRRENGIFGFVIALIISAGMCGTYFLASYINTVGLYGDYAKIEQSKTAMKLYGYYADIPTGADNKIISDLTDQKYEDYQDNMYTVIHNYKTLVSSYNNTLAEKKVLKKGFIFGWLTHCPTDLELVNMNDNLLGKKFPGNFKKLPI